MKTISSENRRKDSELNFKNRENNHVEEKSENKLFLIHSYDIVHEEKSLEQAEMFISNNK